MKSQENYSVTQSFSTENETVQDESKTKSFSNKKDAIAYFEEIKTEMQQGGEILTDLWELDKETDEMEVIDSYYSSFDNSENYGKLVIAFQHTGKGMNYSHKFLDAFWLDKYNEKNLSDNPDNRFKTWHYILNLKTEDLNGLSYEDAQEKVKNEANLRLENSIDLEGLGIEFLNNEA